MISHKNILCKRIPYMIVDMCTMFGDLKRIASEVK